MRITWVALYFTAIVLTVHGGRIGSSRSGGSRSGGWGSSSSSRSSKPSTSYSSGSSWSSKPSTSFSGSSRHSKPSSTHIKPQTTNTHSTSHILPLSTGSRNPSHNSGGSITQTHVTNQQSSGSKPYSPSVPPLQPGFSPHAPSAPLIPGSVIHQPSAPGWKPAVTNDAAQKQHISNLNNQHPSAPPLYPGAPGHYPNQAPLPYPGVPSHYPNQAPPPYPGAPGHYPNHAPPPYPGATGHYPNQAPPPYGAPGHYPNHAPPPYSATNPHYPVQSGGPVYQQQYYAPPPPPPGYSPYGATYYKDKSGIRGSDVVAGLALWELMRSRNHHHSYGIQQVHHHHYDDGGTNYDSSYYQPTYHDTMRERYTTRTSPSRQSTGPGAYNILEMTHYITPDDRGVISSSEGNMTCITVYNAKSISAWHQKQVTDFYKLYPNSTYPLYRDENDTQSENFTVVPGRIVHREPVSITCCGTNKGKVDLNLLTNGKHPDVNCVNHQGHIPIKKLTFVRTDAKVLKTVNTTGWHEIELRDPNVTTPVPLAPYPSSFNSSNSTTGVTTPTTELPTVSSNVTTSTATSVDMNQTFAPLGANNDTEAIDIKQVFDSLGSNSTTESSVSVTTNPSDLIVG